MLTQCPNPNCKFTFEIPDERAGKNGPCLQCSQVITYRSLAIVRRVEEERARLVRLGKASSGGPEDRPLMGLLEDVRSLWNVGSIFRSADGAGVQKLFLCGITGCPPRKEIAKTSLGAEEHVAWAYYAAAMEVLPDLKRRGVTIMGIERCERSRPLTEVLKDEKLQMPLCMAFGNEVSGLSAETEALCDFICELPMRGSKVSLNVAVAFGVASYLVAETLYK